MWVFPIIVLLATASAEPLKLGPAAVPLRPPILLAARDDATDLDCPGCPGPTAPKIPTKIVPPPAPAGVRA